MVLTVGTKVFEFIKENPEICEGKSFEEIVSLFMDASTTTYVPVSSTNSVSIFNIAKGSEEAMGQVGVGMSAQSTTGNEYVNALFLNKPKDSDIKSGNVEGAKSSAQPEIMQKSSVSAEKQKEICQYLRRQYEVARKSYEYQKNVEDSFWEKTADFISHAWNNKLFKLTGNTSTNIEEKLANYLKNIETLEASVGTENFETVFSKAFGTKFNIEKILLFEEKLVECGNIISVVDSADAVSKNLQTMLDKISKLETQYSSTGFVDKRPLNNAKFQFEQTIQEYLGITKLEAIKILEQCNKAGINTFDFYKELARSIDQQAREVKETVLNGKTVKDYQKELTSIYKEAYGAEADIVDQVFDYNRSQKVGGDVIKGATQVVIVTAASVATGGSALAIGLSTAGAVAGIDMIEKGTNGVEGDLEPNDLLDIGKKALIAGTIAGLTAGVLKKPLDKISNKVVETVGGHRFNAVLATSLSDGVREALVETGKEAVSGHLSGDKIAVKAVVAFITTVLTRGAIKIKPSYKDGIKNIAKIEKKGVGDGTISWLRNTENYVLSMAQGDKNALDWIQKNPKDFKVLILALAEEQGMDISMIPEYYELVESKQAT